MQINSITQEKEVLEQKFKDALQKYIDAEDAPAAQTSPDDVPSE